jgi:hypothetical protein
MDEKSQRKEVVIEALFRSSFFSTLKLEKNICDAIPNERQAP